MQNLIINTGYESYKPTHFDGNVEVKVCDLAEYYSYLDIMSQTKDAQVAKEWEKVQELKLSILEKFIKFPESGEIRIDMKLIDELIGKFFEVNSPYREDIKKSKS